MVNELENAAVVLVDSAEPVVAQVIPATVELEDAPSPRPSRSRRGVVIEWRGDARTLTEWAGTLGMPHIVLSSRLGKGWSVERALTKPYIPRPRGATPRCRARKSEVASIRVFAWPEGKRRLDCLACGRTFTSTARNLRTCAPCRRRNSQSFDESVLADLGARTGPIGRAD